MKMTQAQLFSLRSQILAILRTAKEPLLVREIGAKAGLDVSVVGFQLNALWRHDHVCCKFIKPEWSHIRLRQYWLREEDKDDIDKIARMIGMLPEKKKEARAGTKQSPEKRQYGRRWH